MTKSANQFWKIPNPLSIEEKFDFSAPVKTLDAAWGRRYHAKDAEQWGPGLGP